MKPELAFGRVLQLLRKERGLSQERLAELTKLDRTFISLMERGRRQPSLLTILRIAKALDTPGWDLLRRVEDMVAQES